VADDPEGIGVPVGTIDVRAPNELCEQATSAAWNQDTVLEGGAHRVGTRSYRLRDPDRSTPPNGDYEGDDERSLRTAVWYPAKEGLLGRLTPSRNAPLADDGPFPLIVYSHGFMSTNDEGTYLAEVLASRGYVVVAANYPLSHLTAPGRPTMDDLVSQPGDVSFLIDVFVARSAVPDDPLFKSVDPERIAVAGLSMGAMTTSLAAFHRDLRDDRVDVAVTLAGPSSMFSETFYSFAKVPLLLVHGDADAIVDFDANARAAFERAQAPVDLITIVEGSHTGFANTATLFDRRETADEIGCNSIDDLLPEDDTFLDALGGEELGVIRAVTPVPCQGELPPAMPPSKQHELTVLSVVPFFEQHLSADAATRGDACRYLTEGLVAERSELTYEGRR